jgi:hypothetical protein
MDAYFDSAIIVKLESGAGAHALQNLADGRRPP